MEIVSNVLQIVLEYLIPLAVVALISYIITKLKPLLEDKTAHNIITILVSAAEQLYEAGHGEEKLNWVIGQAETWLRQYNITLDIQKIRALVEAEVLKINIEKKLVD